MSLTPRVQRNIAMKATNSDAFVRVRTTDIPSAHTDACENGNAGPARPTSATKPQTHKVWMNAVSDNARRRVLDADA